MSTRVVCAAALGLALVAGLYPAHSKAQIRASEPTARVHEQTLSDAIRVEADTACLEQTRLVAHVKMWLRREHVPADVRVRVHGEADSPRALTFDLAREGTTGQRTFDPAPSSCDETHAVFGLAIALALDEYRAERLLQEARPKPARFRRFNVAASAAYEVLPGASLGLSLGLELAALSWLSVRLDVISLYAWKRAIPDSQGQFDALLVAGSLELCIGAWLDASTRLGLCMGPSAGAVHAWGYGYAPDRSATGLFVGMRSGARLEARIGLRWVLDLEVISPLFSPTFGTQREPGEAPKRRAGATGIALSLGPSFAF